MGAFFVFFGQFSWALRIATWNVHDYTITDRQIEGSFRPNYPKPEVEKKALRATIASINPDVLALQEMGNDAFTQELQADLQAEGLNYPYRATLEAADKKRQLAVLSKIPFKTELFEDLGYRTGGGDHFLVLRGCLGIMIDTNQGPLKIYNVHLKSKIDTKELGLADERRRAEALAIRKAIAPASTIPLRTIVLGDFNDAKNSAAVQTFLKKGSQKAFFLLPAKDSRGESWTHRYLREDAYTRIDHILISEDLQPFIKESSAFIADDLNVAEASDHRLVYIDLEI